MPNYGEIGTAAIRITADGREFPSELDRQIKPAADKTGNAFSKRLGTVLKRGAQVGGAAVGAVFGLAVTKGFQRLTAIDDARNKLLGLKMPAKTVEIVMKNALNSVKGTAFGLGEAATIASGMVAAGIKPGKELEKTLKLVADTAGITGGSLEEIGVVWGQIAAKGRLMGDEMLQLTERGVPILSYLAKHFNITAAEASEMVSKGKVDFATFAAVMQENIGGAALRSGASFTGSMRNVGAALSRLGAGLLGGVFSQMPGVFAELITWIDKITPAAQTAGEWLGKRFAAGIAAAKEWIPTIQRIGAIITGLFALIVKGDFTGGLGRALGIEEDSPIVARILSIRDTIVGLFTKVADMAAGMAGGGAGGGIWAWLTGASALLAPLLIHFGKFLPLIMGLMGPLAKLGPMFKTAFSFLTGPLGITIGLLVAAYASSEEFRIGVNDLLTTIGSLVGLIAAQLLPVFQTLATTLMPVIVDLFAQVGDVVGVLLQAIAPLIAQLVSALVPVITLLVKSVLPPLVSIFNALIPIIMQMVRAVIPPLVSVLGMIAPVIQQLMPVITELIRIFAAMLMPTIQALLPVVRVVFDTITKVIRAALGIIRGIIMVVTGLIKGDWSRVWEGIKAIFSGIWDAIKAIVTGAVRFVWTTLQAGFQIAKTVVSGAWEGIKKLLAAGWDWISKHVFGPIKTGIDLVGKAFSKAKDFIGEQWNKLKELAKAPIKWIIDKVVNTALIGSFNWLSDKIGGPHIDPVSTKWAKGGVLPGYTPGRDVHRFFSPTGGRLELSGGESIMRPEFTRAMGGKRGIDWLNRMARRGLSPFADGGVWGSSRSYADGGIIEWIKSKASDAWGWVTDKAGAIWDAVTKPGEFLKGKLGEWIKNLPGPAKTIVEYGSAAVSKGVAVAVDKIKSLWTAFQSAFAKVRVAAVGTLSGGFKIDRDTLARLNRARIASGIPMSIIQGSWSYNPLSRMTHAGAGAVDLRAAMNWYGAVDALRKQGLLAMFRNWPGNLHIHALNPHVEGLSDAALVQVERAARNHGIFRNGGVTEFDRGGYLRPGLTMAWNGTGQSERVVPAGGGYGPIIVNMTISVDDLAKMSKIGDFLEMLDRARVDARRTERSGSVSA